MPTWSAIKLARVCRAGAAALALVVLSASLAAADYGPRITLGNKYQQWSDVRSADGLALDPGVTCTDTANCYVVFQRIPQKQPLIIQHAACRAWLANGELKSVHLRTRRGQNFPFTWTPLVPVRTTGLWWAVNSPAMHLLRAGELPFFWFGSETKTEWLIDCTISGTLQQPRLIRRTECPASPPARRAIARGTIMPTWNAMTVARACRAGLAGSTFLILSASLAVAFYGPRLTLGNTYQQWSNHSSRNGIDWAFCDGDTDCYIMFQPIPQKRPLIIQRVTCRASVDAGALQSVHLRTRKRRSFPFVWTPLVPVHTTGNWWIVNSPAMHLIRSGERPFIWFHNSTNANLSISCTISGTLQ